MDVVPRIGAGRLPEGTLCLTFDDGPGATTHAETGPRTLDVARYLADEQIDVTFFMCGKHVALHPDIPAQVLALGHQVGNHTHTHRRLHDLDDAELAADVHRSRVVLGESGVDGVIPFRAPWGYWDDRIAGVFQEDRDVSRYHDAVHFWDIDGSDWMHWRDDLGVEACVEAYLTAARAKGSGVVLLHDSTADPDEMGDRMRAANRCAELVRVLVPALRAEGFRFAPLSAVGPMTGETS